MRDLGPAGPVSMRHYLVAVAAADDLNLVRAWWSEVSKSLPSEVRGLWFGLAELASESGALTTTMFVEGTSEFDADDDDWATTTVWQPTDRYVVVPGIASIPSSDWQAVIAYAAEIVTALAPQDTAQPSLEGVGVGFDDGDIHVTWKR
jgi:hypothetical protein